MQESKVPPTGTARIFTRTLQEDDVVIVSEGPRRGPLGRLFLSGLFLFAGLSIALNDQTQQQLVMAVSVRKLSVPDLVVIDQLRTSGAREAPPGLGPTTRAPAAQAGLSLADQPEAASLVNQNSEQQQQQQQLQQLQPFNHTHQIMFECLVSFDKRKDRNLIVKWHHDERQEPIYQWIPELNKRSIAPQYRAFIVPTQQANFSGVAELSQSSPNSTTTTTATTIQAGFRLLKPTKELGGKYTCSAISSQNDDSKSKKMIVYTPPRSFTFNATRSDVAALLANQRDRLIQSAVMNPQFVSAAAQASTIQQQQQQQQLPLAYRMRAQLAAQSAGDLQQQPTTTNHINNSPQSVQLPFGSTSNIDYVNLNQQRRNWPNAPNSHSGFFEAAGRRELAPAQSGQNNLTRQRIGLKLVCDIDQVFPVPEVSIYRLAKPDGSHPEKLAKLETRIERDVQSGLFHVQVTSIVDEEELQARRWPTLSPAQPNFSQLKSNSEEPIYFECLIALTNLELSKYADNKRSISFRPSSLANAQIGDWERNAATRTHSLGHLLLLPPPLVFAITNLLIMHLRWLP